MGKPSTGSQGTPPDILVMGVGSVLMRDEGIGVLAIEELNRRFRFPRNVELLDGGTSGIELLSYISRKDYLIIIDAIKGGSPPGTVLKVEGEDVPARFRTRISPHQIGLSDLLAAATITGEMPRELILIGVEPKLIEMGLGLSEEAREGMERLLGVVVEELRRIGCDVQPLKDVAERRSMWAPL